MVGPAANYRPVFRPVAGTNCFRSPVDERVRVNDGQRVGNPHANIPCRACNSFCFRDRITPAGNVNM